MAPTNSEALPARPGGAPFCGPIGTRWSAQSATRVDDGANRIMMMAGNARTLDTHADRLDALVGALAAEGVDTVVVWQEDEPILTS
jgi:hypothetical protein